MATHGRQETWVNSEPSQLFGCFRCASHRHNSAEGRRGAYRIRTRVRWDQQTLCERVSVHTRALHRDDPSREFRTGIHFVRWKSEEAPSVYVTAWTEKDRVVQIQVSHLGGEICEERSKRIHPDTLPPSPNRVGWCNIFSPLDTSWVRCSTWNLMRISLALEEVGSELRRNWETSTRPTIKLRRGTGFRIHNCERREIEEFRLFLHFEEREGWLRSKGF
jgi:hypothetical protein